MAFTRPNYDYEKNRRESRYRNNQNERSWRDRDRYRDNYPAYREDDRESRQPRDEFDYSRSYNYGEGMQDDRYFGRDEYASDRPWMSNQGRSNYGSSSGWRQNDAYLSRDPYDNYSQNPWSRDEYYQQDRNYANRSSLSDYDRDYSGQSGTDNEGFGNKVRRFFGVSPKGYQRSDERIYEEICESFARDGTIDSSDFDVKVEDAEVTLEGKVESRQDKYRAEHLIDSVFGVKDIHNRLRVERPTSGRYGQRSSDSETGGRPISMSSSSSVKRAIGNKKS